MGKREKIECFDDLAVWIAEFTAKSEATHSIHDEKMQAFEGRMESVFKRLRTLEQRVTVLSIIGSFIGSGIALMIGQTLLYILFKK